MRTQDIQKQINKKEKELTTLKEKLDIERNKVDFIIINGWAYEIKEHDFNKELGDIKIPKGKELWLPSETLKFYEDKKLKEKLNLSKCYFFLKQIREDTKDVARFYAYSDYACLDCDWDSSYSFSNLGVRFKWRAEK